MTCKSHQAIVMALGGWMIVLAGCSHTSYEQDKAAAMDRYNAARSGITYSLALQQYESGDFEKAERTIQQAIAANPKAPVFHVLAGRIAMEKGELERGYLAIKRATEIDPEYADAYYRMGLILQRWQRHEAAYEAYSKAYEHEPDNVNGLLASAEMLVSLDRAPQAIELLKGKLTYFEHNAAIRVSIARMYLMQQQPDSALRMFREAQLLAPEDITLVEHLALAEYSAQNYSEAIYHLGGLVKHEDYKHRRDLRTALGDCYQATGNHKQARLIFLELTQQKPTDIDAWVRLGQAAWIVGDDTRLNMAARQVTSLAPDRYEGQLLVGMVHTRAGRTNQALTSFQKASQLAPDSVLPHIMRGMTLEGAGQAEMAGQAYSMALQMDPQDARVQRLMAGVTAQ